jgi:hypothetical protein
MTRTDTPTSTLRVDATPASEGWHNPADGYSMPFGKYAGNTLEQIPARYLKFLLAKGRGGRATNAILEHLATRHG